MLCRKKNSMLELIKLKNYEYNYLYYNYKLNNNKVNVKFHRIYVQIIEVWSPPEIDSQSNIGKHFILCANN